MIDIDECIMKNNERKGLISEFENKILNNIALYFNSTQIFNGTDFIVASLFSNNMNPEEQIKNGISAIDLGNCLEVIKENYNISNYEDLIIFNIETKNECNDNNDNDDNIDSFNLEKYTQIEIYDMTKRKLNLSVCKENIQLMKYIGDAKKLNIQLAKSLSKQGIDVFNASNEFFNDICHPYESSDGKDIIIDDRRKYIYQNATFCQDGCTYLGMNYNLMVANCKCNSSIFQDGEKNKAENDKTEYGIGSFKDFSKFIISNLLDFNYEVIKCYNLIFNIKILRHNIGFICLSIMLLLQIIFFFIYLIKKVESIKKFMLIYNDLQKINKKKNNLKKNSPPKKIYILKILWIIIIQ